jgi:hypothetical protein
MEPVGRKSSSPENDSSIGLPFFKPFIPCFNQSEYPQQLSTEQVAKVILTANSQKTAINESVYRYYATAVYQWQIRYSFT